MINIRQFITEKLKVSSSNISEIDFDTFAEALYTYCRNKNTHFNLNYLDVYKDSSVDVFPYFENPYSVLNAKGYITEISGGMYKGEYRIRIFYVEATNKKVRSVTVLNKEQFSVLTDAIEPKILQEIYDYLIDHA